MDADAKRLRHNEQVRAWNAANKDKYNGSIRNWQLANPDKVKEKAKRYREAHKDQIRESQRRWREANPGRSKEAQKRYREANREKVLDDHSKSNWKAAGYPAPTRPRPELCEACGERDPRSRLHLDHDHETGTFRGWLCRHCNMAIGNSKDSPEILRSLADYLERNQ